MDNKKKLIGAAVVIGILIVGVVGGRFSVSQSGGDRHEPGGDAVSEKKDTLWTCSMHPQIKKPKPGKCPICGMALIPLEEGGGEGPRELHLSEAARKLAEVEVIPARRKEVTRTVRLVGKVDYDETRIATIAAWVPGRLDRLYVDYTGITVRKGDHMVYLYSPEIQTAQEELLQAISAEKALQAGALRESRNSARATTEAAREKLRLWGLTKSQVAAIEKTGVASDHITIKAPIGGIVIHKNAVEGAYVKTGAPIYRIADLSVVWVKLDAYESDLPWLRYGQDVQFTSESYPGDVFNGRISFIDPTLTMSSRTIKVRVNLKNDKGRLKPGMFVRAEVKAVLGDGEVREVNLAGKWVCPMHPEIIKDNPGKCDICGMDLTKGVGGQHDVAPPLVIPAAAVLITGTRAVVYVQQKDPSKFAGRTITLGPRADDFYVVKSGLKEGDKVVVNGNFKIDSALQIVAKPSMMSADDNTAMEHAGHMSGAMKMSGPVQAPKAFMAELANVFDSYFAIQAALGKDKGGEAGVAAKSLLKQLNAVDMKLLKGHAHMTWMGLSREVQEAAKELSFAKDIEKARLHFKALSIAMKRVAKTFGTGKDTVYVNMCPMAFNNTGAEWLQGDAELLNPYFGTTMPGCGELVEKIAAKPVNSKADKTQEGSHHDH